MQALMGLFGGTQVKTNVVEFSTECSDDSKVLTEQNSNKVEVIERGQSDRVKLRKEDVPGAILHREIAAAMASLPWS